MGEGEGGVHHPHDTKTVQRGRGENEVIQPRTEPESKERKEGEDGRRLRVHNPQPGPCAPRPSETAQKLAPNRTHNYWGRGAGT